MRLPLLIVTDEKSLEEFCYCLYQVGYECVSEDTKNYICDILKRKAPYSEESTIKEIAHYWKEKILKNDDFYCDIDVLRHYYIHLKGKDTKNSRENWEKRFKACLLRRNLKTLSNDYEYYIFQRKILEDFYAYLDKLDTIFRTHDIFKG